MIDGYADRAFRAAPFLMRHARYRIFRRSDLSIGQALPTRFAGFRSNSAVDSQAGISVTHLYRDSTTTGNSLGCNQLSRSNPVSLQAKYAA
jgi:hypothetical protein